MKKTWSFFIATRQEEVDYIFPSEIKARVTQAIRWRREQRNQRRRRRRHPLAPAPISGRHHVSDSRKVGNKTQILKTACSLINCSIRKQLLLKTRRRNRGQRLNPDLLRPRTRTCETHATEKQTSLIPPANGVFGGLEPQRVCFLSSSEQKKVPQMR